MKNHGAKEGRKIELIKKNPVVGFEMDTNYALHEGDLACGHSARFQSIIGNGVVSIVSEMNEKNWDFLCSWNIIQENGIGILMRKWLMPSQYSSWKSQK